MPVSMDDVRAVVEAYETDYERARTLGPEALPHLAELVRAGDPMIASKAAYLAGLIGAQGSAEIVADAARNADPVVRVAAADAARHLPAEAASEIVLTLVDDADRGVQRVALTSVPTDASPALRQRLEELSSGGRGPQVRDLAARAVSSLDPPST